MHDVAAFLKITILMHSIFRSLTTELQRKIPNFNLIIFDIRDTDTLLNFISD